MQKSGRLRLAVIVGLASTSAVTAQTLTAHEPAGERQQELGHCQGVRVEEATHER